MTQEIIDQWSQMRGLTQYDAAKEIKLLLDLGTVKEKRPFAEGRLENNSPTLYHEIG